MLEYEMKRLRVIKLWTFSFLYYFESYFVLNFQKLPAPTKEITVYNHNRLYRGRGKENEYSYMLR